MPALEYAMITNLKDELHTLAEQLPPDATWKDVLYEAYVRQAIAAGRADAEHGMLATDDEVKSAFAKWGVQIETEMDPARPAPTR